MRDHLMGYAPAMREDFGEPEVWSYCLHFGLGPPVRMRGLWEACEQEPDVPRGTPRVTAASAQCMTRGDLVGLEAQEGPQPAPGEPSEPEVMVTLPNAQGCVYTHDLVRRVPRETPTLSPAAEWPFAGQGWRNEPQAVESFVSLHKQRQLEKLKAAEHERWLAAEEQRKRDAITACYSEKGCKA